MQAYASSISNTCHRASQVAKQFNKSVITTKKYLNMSKSEIKELDNITVYKKREKNISAYFNMIYKMIHDGYKREIIYWYVISKGYSGTINQLDKAIKSIAINNFGIKYGILHLSLNYEKGSIVIDRNDLLKEITARGKKYNHNSDILKYMNLIIERYPIVKIVKDIYESFYSTIMGNNPDKLDEFIATFETKKEKDESGKLIVKYQSPISSFIEGLKKDITPAKNAISFTESSGFVEGNNCKFKLVKRILYGRANLVNLFRKCYLCFSFKKNNFSLKGSYSLAK